MGFGKVEDDLDEDGEDEDCSDAGEARREEDARFYREADAASDEDMNCEFFSPFGPEVFATAAACWAHAEQVHGFSLRRLREGLAGAWTDYHRIRLVNHLRRMGREEACLRAAKLNQASLAAIWEDDELLKPVVEDDALLWEEEDDDDGGGGGVEDGGWGADSRPSGGAEASRVAAVGCTTAAGSGAPAASCGRGGPAGPEADEVSQLRAALASAQRLLAEATGCAETGRSSGASVAALSAAPVAGAAAPAFDAARTRAVAADLCQAYAAALAEAPGIQGRTVLNAACGAGVLSCLAARLGAVRVFSLDEAAEALELVQQLAAANGVTEALVLLRGRASAAGGPDRGLACDVVLSERWASELRYSPALLELLQARRRHLKPGGRVLPPRATILLEAADFSKELARDAALRRGPADVLADLDLRPLLAASTAELPFAEEGVEVPTSRISSAEPCTLLALDLTTATPEEALLARARFELSLRPGCVATSLLLRVEAPAAGGSALAAGPGTVLHLPAGAGPPPRLLGGEAARLEGTLSASWAPGGALRLSIEWRAAGAGGRGDVLLRP